MNNRHNNNLPDNDAQLEKEKVPLKSKDNASPSHHGFIYRLFHHQHSEQGQQCGFHHLKRNYAELHLDRHAHNKENDLDRNNSSYVLSH